ncbi:ribose-phosphate pyrophosphokinase [Anaeromicropila populeti]|uniref:ribose-phosphate diphosphokinase n=1 Tax=Anaeromicropila populeti TaxID=37658 RepID=A0A1I6L7G6_9FIRM|nr:ribose-phosphate pyrophosphokinase [Anaeromicropila populeti]SFR99352.1 ribose-phosphate pyrophosphokinase [Anaeromicropila populeti]
MYTRPLNLAMPVAPLKLIALDSSKELGDLVNEHLVASRKEQLNDVHTDLSILGYDADSYLVQAECPRFGSGEAKAVIKNSIRGTDLFILLDTVNPTISYTMNQETNRKSPDDHFQDVKRIIQACRGQTHRINVIMPFLYESRQHRRSKLESLDCALALQELVAMGVDNIITFDAHDPRVQNAIPIQGFDNFYTSFQFIRALIESEPSIQIDSEHMMVISPDEGGMTRSVYYAGVLGVDMGMFYKRRDYSVIVNGKNPIVAHEYLGNSVEGKAVFIVDDMIASGESMLDVAKELKKRKARKVYIAATYGLFTEGLSKFDACYEEGLIDRIFTTNLSYCSKELLEKPYYTCVDLSKYIALIIDTLNNDTSVNEILNPLDKIQELLNR